MLLSDYLNLGTPIMRQAILKIDLELDDGESLKVGDDFTVVRKYDDGTYHAEHNEFACRVERSEFEFISKN